MDLSQHAVEQVARLCVEENTRYEQEWVSNPDYCFELFRRALADLNETALNFVREIYNPRLERWVRRLWQFAQTGEEAEYFAQEAFVNFYFASAGPKFAKYQSLGRIINYMKTCVFTAVTLYLRGQFPTEPAPEGFDPPDPNTEFVNLKVDALWQHICTVLTDEKERLLANLAFVQEMKPREIVPHYGHIWQTESQVSMALFRIRRKLYGDTTLARWLNDEDVVQSRL
jgi:hypothetical protein